MRHAPNYKKFSKTIQDSKTIFDEKIFKRENFEKQIEKTKVG